MPVVLIDPQAWYILSEHLLTCNYDCCIFLSTCSIQLEADRQVFLAPRDGIDAIDGTGRSLLSFCELAHQCGCGPLYFYAAVQVTPVHSCPCTGVHSAINLTIARMAGAGVHLVWEGRNSLDCEP